MLKRWRIDTPLCPAGHLPHKGGEWLSSGTAQTSPNASAKAKRLISPLVGEMPGKAEGGEHRHHALSLVILAATLLLTHPTIAAPLADIPVMHEEAQSAGLTHAYRGPWEYFVGGGAASFDCNGDRMPDLFIAGGRDDAALFVSESTRGSALKFSRRDHGLGRDGTRVLGAYPLDIDNDGHKDLVLLRLGENIILKGGPNCSFERANDAFAFDGGRAWTTAFSAMWEPDARFPTLAFGNYVDRSAPGSPWGTCHDNALYRPEQGTNGPLYEDRRALTPGYCALSMLFTDWNRSGTPDLRITNDRHYYRGGEEQLWHVEPGRSPRLYSRSEGWRHLTIWGMGIAEADIDADGYPEYALTSMGDTKLQKLDEEAEEDRPIYRDIAFDRGATAHRPYQGDDLKPSTGWHAEFADFNNDSLADLFIAKGNVEAMPDFAATDPDNLLIGQWDGSFEEAGGTSGIGLPTKGRGAVVTDFNADGLLDLLVVNREQNVSLFRNKGMKQGDRAIAGGNFVAVELAQKGANRNAVGALISIKIGTRTVNRTIQLGGGHASGHAGFIHAGLGTSERAEIRVKWPDGEWSHPYRVFANNFVRIERGEAEARYWYPVE
ncbi:FG-GAP repeat domain-containing protein [Nitratireductor basaltis]|uniref:ASPIC/UnbV n=1 Tax=Nitratireductor basaltis TaxID=472175 RepID=A0A084U7D5_9HYPH|nr:VCBS repeat-containing protein [Nitratireductor basaltis]KFB08871.1 ASPIC/UnbV [Nitratireductor basaltis]